MRRGLDFFFQKRRLISEKNHFSFDFCLRLLGVKIFEFFIRRRLNLTDKMNNCNLLSQLKKLFISKKIFFF